MLRHWPSRRRRGGGSSHRRSTSRSNSNRSLLGEAGEAPMTVLMEDTSNHEQTGGSPLTWRHLSKKALDAPLETEKKIANRRPKLRKNRPDSLSMVDAEFQALEALLIGQKKFAGDKVGTAARRVRRPPTTRRVPNMLLAPSGSSRQLVSTQ